jgi:predicted aconitase
LKALGAAAASSGSVAMFHAVGATPEAATLDDALQGERPELMVDVTLDELRSTRKALHGTSTAELSAVAVGTPHFSLAEFESLRSMLDGRSVQDGVPLFISTGRETLARVAELDWADELEALGIILVADTCTYLRPMLDFGPGQVLTNSAKWAWYAPMTLGVEVTLGSLRECVESAVSGRLELVDGF